MIFTLRPYQLEVIERIRTLLQQGVRRIIVQAETGSGKTVIACELMKLAVQKGSRCLFLAGARELINQASNKLEDFGVHHGIIMAGRGYTPAMVQVASKDTLTSRALRRKQLELPPAQLVIVDEARMSTSKVWQELLARYPYSVIIGLDATPCKAKGDGLGDYYKGLVQVVQRSQLIQDGYIVPTMAYAPYIPNLKPKKGEKMLNSVGDYREDFLAKRMDRPTLVGDIVRWWKKLGQDLPTMFFGSSVDHSIHVRDEFMKAGIAAEHIDATTDECLRRDILGNQHVPGSLGDGKLKVLCNYGVLVSGIDQPCVGCIIMGRPTRSFTIYKQAIGRGARPYSGPLYQKSTSILLDHAGVVYAHGLPDDDITWTLEPSKLAHQKSNKKPGDSDEPALLACPRCATVFSGTNKCPNCGHVIEKQHRPACKENKDGVLVRVTKEDLAHPTPSQHMALVRLWHKCLAVSSARDLTPRHAAIHFRSATGGTAPYEVPGLPNMPATSEAWDRKVRQIFPQYWKPKVT